MWGAGMAKKLILIVLTVLMLSGCGVIRESRHPGEKIPVSVLDLSQLEYYGRVEKSAVYFLNESSGTLTAELRTLIIGHDANPATAAIEQLMSGPSNDTLKSVAPDGMRLDLIEYSNGVANVYLHYDGEELQGRQAFVLELAITNTVTDILGAGHINVFYNGLRKGFMGYPSAPLRKQTGSIDEAWLSASARYLPETQVTPEEEEEEPDEEQDQQPKVSEISTVLYFVSASGDYILPEIRLVKYTEGEYIQTLIDELKKGPQDTATMVSPFATSLSLAQEPQFETTDHGTQQLRLYFDTMPIPSDFAQPEETALSYAALVYTITGFLPNVESIELYAADNLIATDIASGGVLMRKSLRGYIGSSAPLYFADSNSDLLLEVSRSMEQNKTWSAKARILELMRGPLTQDGNNVLPIKPLGVTERDILSVDVFNDTAYVNLSQNFKDACANHSARSEMQLVFSIVNTITAMDGISKVQFTVEGKQTDALSGHLCMSDPFLRNFGIIKSSS